MRTAFILCLLGLATAASAASMRSLFAIVALIAATAAARGAEPPPVSYFDSARVRAAFAAGAVLFDGAGRNYMVHASRREQAGQGELHTLDADIIYVLDGSATFVTGGALVEPRETAANEIRGSAIAGGETRTIATGDVIIVPAGTPHWFKAIQGPVLYYVVKVR